MGNEGGQETGASPRPYVFSLQKPFADPPTTVRRRTLSNVNSNAVEIGDGTIGISLDDIVPWKTTHKAWSSHQDENHSGGSRGRELVSQDHKTSWESHGLTFSKSSLSFTPSFLRAQST